jgi:hypothetical protein
MLSVQQIIKSGLKYSSNWLFGNKGDQPKQFKGIDFGSGPSGATFSAWGTFLVANAKVCSYSFIELRKQRKKA